MSETKKTVEVGNKKFVFRLPTGEDMIEIDLAALRMRQGATEGLNIGYNYTQNIATLQQILVTPEEFEFKKLPFYELEELSSEVVAWINSFRNRVGKKQGEAAGTSPGQGE